MALTINNNAFNACLWIGHWLYETRFSKSCGRVPNTASPENLDVTGAYYHFIQSTFFVNQEGQSQGSVGEASLSIHGAQGWSLTCTRWYSTGGFCRSGTGYIGTMYSAAYGGLANGDIAREQSCDNAGVRFRF